jgi:hypothetical protein
MFIKEAVQAAATHYHGKKGAMGNSWVAPPVAAVSRTKPPVYVMARPAAGRTTRTRVPVNQKAATDYPSRK